VQEVLDDLITAPDGVYVDGTVGSGATARRLEGESRDKGSFFAWTEISEAIRISRQRLSFLGEKVRFIKASYADVNEVLRTWGGEKLMASCWIWNVGFQLEQSGRGFSFYRMNRSI